MNVHSPAKIEDLLGIGFYTVPEAARLLKIAPLNIRRWLSGYSYRERGKKIDLPPLWTPQLPKLGDRLELGFRDLIELRFIVAFQKAGLGLKAIRLCLDYARDCVQDDRPFSTRKFQTDGQTIFLERLRQTNEAELLDLKKRQFVFRNVVEQTFRDLDIENDAVARWRPLDGKESIVIDPLRAFGQPIAAHYGVPTSALADAVEAEGSISKAAKVFDVSVAAVRDALRFERALAA